MAGGQGVKKGGERSEQREIGERGRHLFLPNSVFLSSPIPLVIPSPVFTFALSPITGRPVYRLDLSTHFRRKASLKKKNACHGVEGAYNHL